MSTKRKHGPSSTERKPGSPTVRNWRQNLIALILLGVFLFFIFFLIIRRAF